MMHAKTVVVDDAWSVVGSANMDERSMELNEENIVGIADAGFAGAIAEGLEADFARSREVRLEEWRRRPLLAAGARGAGQVADRAVLRRGDRVPALQSPPPITPPRSPPPP